MTESQEQGTKPAAGDPTPRRRRRRRRNHGGGEPTRDNEPQRDAGPGAGKDGKRRRRPGGGEHAPAGPDDDARTAAHHLCRVARALLDEGGVDLLARPRFMEIKLRVPVDGARDLAEVAAEVRDQIRARVRDVREHDRALVPGAVYSYFAESSAADGCRPQQPREVFDGYTSTGRPQFTDFVTLAIERKAEGIDDLLNGEDVIVSHVAMGRVLRTQQLAEFGKGSPVYRILGQVDAGLFALRGDGGKAAFSFQLLRGTTLEGKPRLRIHAVGAADLHQLRDHSVALTLMRFQRRLEHEALRLAGKEANGDGNDDEAFALPLLTDLARQLVGRHKRKSRRTGHANDRADEGQRPTTKAWADARTASDDQVLTDAEEDTVVVIGPRNRIHVFTRDARHVTSVVMSGGAVQSRRQQGRWLPSEPEQRGEFRTAVRRRTEAGQTEVADEAPPPPRTPPAAEPEPQRPTPPNPEATPPH